MGERLRAYQWLGVLIGLAGVALVVWHRIDVRALSLPALICVLVSLVAITIGTLYQRAFCPTVDLRAAALVQFAATLATLLPLAITFEGFEVRPEWALAGAIGFLVVFSSILVVNALHTLMRRGEATRVTSLLYLSPIIAVALEWLLEEDGEQILLHTFENYWSGDLEVVRALLEDPATVCGLGDAGAHVGYMCDAGSATSMLVHWNRQRTRGPRLPLEFLVKKQTADTARVYGLLDPSGSVGRDMGTP